MPSRDTCPRRRSTAPSPRSRWPTASRACWPAGGWSPVSTIPIDMAHRPGRAQRDAAADEVGQAGRGLRARAAAPGVSRARAAPGADGRARASRARSSIPATMGTMAEHYVRGVKPLYDNVHAYNQFLYEDWGFDYQSRIYTPALLSLRDLDSAVARAGVRPRPRRQVHHAQRRTGLRTLAGRQLFRSVLGSHQRGRSQRGLPHRRVLVQRKRRPRLGI